MTEDRNLIDALSRHRPKKVFSRRWSLRSAVALVLDSDASGDAALLLIKRAQREGDPWSGHMAFPGGRKDDDDRNGLATAVREMHEEVGFDIGAAPARQIEKGRLIGRLSDVRTTRRVIPVPMVVSPYVFSVAQRPPLSANEEVADTLWIPLSFFCNRDNRSKMELDYGGKLLTMPCYHFRGEVIWGLTLSILDELSGLSGSHFPRWYRV